MIVHIKDLKPGDRIAFLDYREGDRYVPARQEGLVTRIKPGMIGPGSGQQYFFVWLAESKTPLYWREWTEVELIA